MLFLKKDKSKFKDFHGYLSLKTTLIVVFPVFKVIS